MSVDCFLDSNVLIYAASAAPAEAAKKERRYGIHYWDGAIVAAAEMLAAPILYSEDLSDGQRYGSVVVRNPFVSPR